MGIVPPLILALTDIVPALGRFFSGKDANLLNQVVDAAKKVTNQTQDEAILEKLSDPKILLQFHEALLNIERDLEVAYLEDRQSARLRDEAFIKSNIQNIRADIMVVAAACGLVSCLASLALYQAELPGEAVGIISTIAGIFGACLKDAYAFEFGSSRGSKAKDDHVSAFIQRRL